MKIHCLYDKLVSVKDLKLDPDNRNKHSKKQIERLATILNYQGWRYPIKISTQTGLVRSGHGRIQAAKLNKWKEVPVVYQDYESLEQEIADSISNNSIASWAELDLEGINADLEVLGPDFDVDLLGIQNFTVDLSEKTPEKEVDFDAKFRLSIEFETEEEQCSAFDLLQQQGYQVKIVNI